MLNKKERKRDAERIFIALHLVGHIVLPFFLSNINKCSIDYFSFSSSSIGPKCNATELIDNLLEQYDRDNDGLISYSEYRLAQGRS